MARIMIYRAILPLVERFEQAYDKDVRPCKNAIKSNEARHIRKGWLLRKMVHIHFPSQCGDGFFAAFLKILIWPYNQISR
ncbi:MAG: hypothetical protein IPL11_03355 [Candidatus Accumulibacter sp.]|nr:hypothetical protein [Accumulibacter sp.]